MLSNIITNVPPRLEIKSKGYDIAEEGTVLVWDTTDYIRTVKPSSGEPGEVFAGLSAQGNRLTSHFPYVGREKIPDIKSVSRQSDGMVQVVNPEYELHTNYIDGSLSIYKVTTNEGFVDSPTKTKTHIGPNQNGGWWYKEDYISKADSIPGIRFQPYIWGNDKARRTIVFDLAGGSNIFNPGDIIEIQYNYQPSVEEIYGIVGDHRPENYIIPHSEDHQILVYGNGTFYLSNFWMDGDWTANGYLRTGPDGKFESVPSNDGVPEEPYLRNSFVVEVPSYQQRDLGVALML